MPCKAPRSPQSQPRPDSAHPPRTFLLLILGVHDEEGMTHANACGRTRPNVRSCKLARVRTNGYVYIEPWRPHTVTLLYPRHRVTVRLQG